MKKKYDWYWLIRVTIWGLLYGVTLYIILCTALAMAQHGNQTWNMWHIIAEGVRR